MRESIAFETLLFPCGSAFDLRAQEKRAKHFMKDFTTVTQLDRHLHSSSLKFKFSPRNEGLFFQILCVENKQRRLHFPSINRLNEPDPFNTDILKVKSSIDEIVVSILEATSPVLSAEELRESKSNTVIRTAARGRINTLFDDFELFKQARLATTFPRGTQALLLISIKKIERTHVTVRVHPVTPPNQTELLNARFTKELKLYLPAFECDPTIHAELFEAMHSMSRIAIQAVIAWRSANGQPAHLEFVKLHNDQQE